jgi:Holliday junction resolvase RusA-like endonuclease
MKITFFVPGNPVALKRHRTVTRDRYGKPLPHAREYDPSVTDKKDFLAKAMQWRPSAPFDSPVRLDIVVHMPRPKSHYKTNGMLKLTSPSLHTSTPDYDNFLKFIGDALNGVFWKDDRYIACGSWVKKYSDTPGIEITVTGE